MKKITLSLYLPAALCLFLSLGCTATDEVSCPDDSGSNVDFELDSTMEPVTTVGGEVVFPVDGVEQTETYNYQYTCGDYISLEEVIWEDTDPNNPTNPGSGYTITEGTINVNDPGLEVDPNDLDELCFYRAQACSGSSCGCYFPEPQSVIGA